MKCPICEAKNPTKLTKNNYKCEHCGSWFSIEGKYISLDETPLSNMEPKENILMEGINIIEENSRLGRKVKEQQKEIDELMESIKNVLEAIDESKRVDALFELKNLYKAILKRTK